MTEDECPECSNMSPCCGYGDEPVPDDLHRALGRTINNYHWRAFCDSWLAIGLAATAVRWGGDGIIGWRDEQECCRVLAEAVGRVVRRRKP